MSEGAKGVLAMVLVCVIWGTSGLFFKALAVAPPGEVLAHRVIWSVVFFGVLLAAQGRLGELRVVAGRGRNWLVLATTATLIAVNWFVFVVAIQTGRGIEASLGYYIFPLVAVGLGYLVLGERLSRVQGAAVVLATAAVGVLTLGLGEPPWIALLLAGSFGGYGLVKNRLGLAPDIGVFFETGLLAPIALVWLLGLHWGAWSDPGGRPGALFGDDARVTLLLALSGPLMTGGPLILFSFAARRVRLGTLGLVQYLNPSLQFLVAVAIFGEPLTRWHMVALPMIWAGLALYSAASWRREHAARANAAGAEAAAQR